MAGRDVESADLVCLENAARGQLYALGVESLDTHGCRDATLLKVRWGRAGSGKSGGVRVIYFARTAEEEVVLLNLYAKAQTDNLGGAKLREIRRALES